MTDATPPTDDVTVLRPTSVTGSRSGGSYSGSSHPVPGVDAPRVLKQRFVLEEKLGSGGMGTVFRAKDLRKVEAQDRNPFVAVKVLNNDFREHPEAFVALEREASKSQKLAHPNIVSIFDFDKDGDLPYIIMELLEGQELSASLQAFPAGLPDNQLWPLVRGLCAGLGHAHQAGLVHADFKPGNVFVGPDNRAKILDFGIARAVRLQQHRGEDTIFDPANLAALTPAYASREMLKGDTPTPRDDLYSLGVVIYLMVTGHHPFGRLSADEAAREGLVPERPKRLSARQWRGLRRALAFNRAQRPEDVEELRSALLDPSPWRTRTAYAAAAAFVLAIALSTFWGGSQRAEVAEEVRQTTLLDVQVQRVDALLTDPPFSQAWHRTITEELQALGSLPGGADLREERRAQLGELYAAAVRKAPDHDRALLLLRRGQRFAPLDKTAAWLDQQIAESVEGLLAAPQANLAWVQALDRTLARHREAFPDSPRRARLDNGVATALAGLVRQALARDEVQFARAALARINPEFLGSGTYPEMLELLEEAQVRQQATAAAAAAAAERARFEEALAPLLAPSCLRFDPALAAERVAALGQQFPGLAGEGRSRLLSRLAGCVVELGSSDRDRALKLHQEAVARFGAVGPLAEVQLDPCGLGYLVGNGAQAGRRGYCVDRLGADAAATLGPRLVVVPMPEGAPLAFTKEEVTWGMLGPYCRESGLCEPLPDAALPVTGIPVAVAEAYAGWLTEQTGFRYRLPTVDEWLAAATGDPDPNRNCRVQVGGAQRGLALLPADAGPVNPLGLVHLLGNAREWVRDGDLLQAAGGDFQDALAQCTAERQVDHDGQPDPVTGFRLVREIP